MRLGTYEPPVVARVEDHRHPGGCNFCTRGITTDESKYPVTIVTRAAGGGLEIRICDECLAHVNGHKHRRNLPR